MALLGWWVVVPENSEKINFSTEQRRFKPDAWDACRSLDCPLLRSNYSANGTFNYLVPHEGL